MTWSSQKARLKSGGFANDQPCFRVPTNNPLPLVLGPDFRLKASVQMRLFVRPNMPDPSFYVALRHCVLCVSLHSQLALHSRTSGAPHGDLHGMSWLDPSRRCPSSMVDYSSDPAVLRCSLSILAITLYKENHSNRGAPVKHKAQMSMTFTPVLSGVSIISDSCL